MNKLSEETLHSCKVFIDNDMRLTPQERNAYYEVLAGHNGKAEEIVSAQLAYTAYSPETVARMLHVSERSVFRFIKTGEIPSFTVGRCRRIPASAIQKLLSDKAGVN